MLGRRVRWLFALVLLPLQLTAVHAASAPLQPRSPWQLDMAETQCAAAREYGSAADPVTFGIRPSPSGDSYELMLARRRAGPNLAKQLQGSVDFGSGPIHGWALHFGDRTTSIHQFRISAEEMAQSRTAPTVTFDAKGPPAVTLALAAMPALLSGLQRCTDDLMRHWNYGGEADGRIMTPAMGDLRSIFRTGDFPQEAMVRRQEGSSRFLLLIDELGRVAGCHALSRSGVPSFDVMGCQVIRQRARFTPAKNVLGIPVRSMVASPPVYWRLNR